MKSTNEIFSEKLNLLFQQKKETKKADGIRYTKTLFVKEFFHLSDSADTEPDRSKVNNWFRKGGKASIPNAETVLDLARFFDCDMEYLLTETPDRHAADVSIQKQLGFADIKAVENLKYEGTNLSHKKEVLNKVLSSEEFQGLVRVLNELYIWELNGELIYFDDYDEIMDFLQDVARNSSGHDMALRKAVRAFESLLDKEFPDGSPAQGKTDLFNNQTVDEMSFHQGSHLEARKKAIQKFQEWYDTHQDVLSNPNSPFAFPGRKKY